MAKKEKVLDPINFQGNNFEGFSYINTIGDTIRLFTTTEARPGEYYQIEYVMPKNNGPMKIRTEKETGELLAGRKYAVDPNGNIGDWLNEYFLNSAKQLPINHDRSKATGLKKLGYKVLEYFDKFQQGGQVANQLGQITKAAIEMANAFKKQGVISEIAGEQAIAQAFSNNQKEAQVFASFIKNVQTKKQAPTQEELQAVLELFTKLGIVK